MNLTRRTAMLAVAGTISLDATVLAEDAVRKDDGAKYAPLFPLYSCATSQYEDLSPLMKTFSDSFGGRSINALARNPRCCVWFEIVGAANPGSDGWYVWHEAGGTIITATNLGQMKKAVDALNRIAKAENEKRLLRTGITTSFPVSRVP